MNNNSFIYIGMEAGGHACLKALLQNDIVPAAVFTIHESKKESVTAYQSFADLDTDNVPFFYIPSINEVAVISKIRDIRPTLIVTAYWSELLKDEIVTLPKHGCVGLHCSLLPKHRGRAPLPWSIIFGVKKTGVTLFYFTPYADDGDIIAQKSFIVEQSDYAVDLYNKAKDAATFLLVEYIPKLLNGTAPRTPQEGKYADYWHKRTPQDGVIDWNKKAIYIYDWIRALSRPFPGAFTYCQSKKIIIISSHIFSLEDNFEQGHIYWDVSGNDIVVGTGEGALAVNDLMIDGRTVEIQKFRSMFQNICTNFDKPIIS